MNLHKAPRKLGYVPSVGASDAMDYMDTVAADIIQGARSSAFLGLIKSCPPLEAEEIEAMAKAAISHHTDDPHLGVCDLECKLLGYRVVEYPYMPLHGIEAREALADFLVWAATFHNEDPETMHYIAAMPHQNPVGWDIFVFSKLGTIDDPIHAKVIDQDMIGSSWDSRSIGSHIYTYFPNPFHATPEDIARVRGPNT